MMTLGRFRVVLDSYGADPQRWPQELRADAQALLIGSATARAMLEQAGRLDAAIAVATAREHATLAPLSSPDEALQRLRSRVAVRIGSGAELRTEQRAAWTLVARIDRLLSPRLYWAGMATGGGVAIAAGLLLGAIYTTPPAADGVLAILQSSPMVILAD